MRYRPLGESGLVVSVAGLGCNNFGGRLDTDGTRAVVDAAIDAGITLFDTSDTYGGGGGSERALGEILGRRRDQIVLATKFGHQGADMGYGPAAGAKGGRAYIRRAVDRVAAAVAHRLHRPVPAAHAGSGDPGRGDHRGTARAGRRGQGPVPGPFQFLRLAARRRRAPGGDRRPHPVHLRPESLVAARARGRGGCRARGQALRPGRAALLPAGQRAADREGAAGSAGPGREQAGQPRGLRHRREAGQGRGADRLGPASMASRSWRRPSAPWPPSRAARR